MGAILIHQSGPNRGRKEKLGRGLTRLGRKSDNDVVFSQTQVSSHHAQIQKTGDRYTLVDLDSTNGTLVNGNRIGKAVLHDHDRIELGENGPLLEFRTEEAEAVDFPRIIPISGWWEHGKGPIKLKEGSFTLGRSKESDIVVGRSQDPVVSGRHAEINIQSNSCKLEDLDSTNGVYLNGERIQVANLHNGDRVELGRGGPKFEFHWKGRESGHRRSRSAETEKVFQKLKDAARGGQAGEQTMIYLRAAHKYYKSRRWPLIVFSVVALAGLVVAGVYIYREVRENQQLRQQLTQRDHFYEMRRYEMTLVGQADSLSQAEKQSLLEKRRRLLAEYENYLEKVDWYKRKSRQEKAVLRLARNLGETSLEVPPDFVAKALQGVEDLKRTTRLSKALEQARAQNLLERIRTVLDQHDLPREFLFIAFRESAFNPNAVGPETRTHQFAKGMWQLMPETARQYALKTGPLEKEKAYDPMDERHIADLSTQAAAKYLAFLYSSKAAASGLLVIASYNYGQRRVIEKLDTLPPDPKVRNFWYFYRQGWVPDETRVYVMDIFSAALLSLNPELFGSTMKPIDREW